MSNAVFVVLGMHRSGTSAVSAALSSLGVFMGDNLSGPAEDNPKGFWEEKKIVEFNEKLLKHLGMRWDSLAGVHDSQWSADSLQPHLLEAVKLLRDAYRGHEYWGFKDPRVCRTLLLWQAALKHLSVQPKYVIVVRNPLSVARSLAARNRMAPEKAHLLWLEHYLPVVTHTAGLDRLFVDYDKLLEDPRMSLLRLAEFLDLPAGQELEPAIEHFAADFLSDALRHTVFERDDVALDETVNGLTREAYKGLSGFSAGGDGAVSAADNLSMWRGLAHQLESMKPLWRYADSLLDSLENQSEAIEKQSAESHAELMRLSDRATGLKTQLDVFQAENRRLTEVLQVEQEKLSEALANNRNAHAELLILQDRISAIDRSFLARSFERLSRYGYIGLLKKIVRRLLPEWVLDTFRYLQHRKALPGLESALKTSRRRIVIAFPIIIWGFRWQRPQHILSQLADAGFTVIYLAMGVQPKGRSYYSRDDAGVDIRLSELREGVFKLWLHSCGQFNIYTDALENENLQNLRLGIASLLAEIQPVDITYMVQFPGWANLAMVLRHEFGGTIVFDCMDDHSGFNTNSEHSLQDEESLLRGADLVVATSSLLCQRAHGLNRNVCLVRNGTEFDHFHHLLPNGKLDNYVGKPVIGYYGAISDWFDVALVAECATRHPDWNFVLIGSTAGCEDVNRLHAIANIALLDEIPYPDLPGYVFYFDVCLIPFKITPLTLATNPVKFYEYLSSGKPVVSVPLPELEQYRELCYLAGDVTSFIENIEQALQEKQKPHLQLLERRIALARESSWTNRANEIMAAIDLVKQGEPT